MMNKDKIPQGYKNSPLGIIPKEWEVKRLKSCCIGKGEYGINAPAVEFSESLPTYLRITDIDDDGKFISHDKKSVRDNNANKFFLEKGDIVFARTGATVGKTYLHDEKDGRLVFAGFLIRFKPDRRKILPYFLKLSTATSIYWDWVKKISVRSGQPGINAEEYGSLKICLPPLPEQQKIAEILSCWDEVIEKQSQLIDKLEIRKHGLMQQLLTGKKRIKGFDEKWETVQLKKIGKTFTGLTNKSKKDFGKGKPYIPYLNIFNNSKIDISHFENVIISPTEKQNTTRYGDLFFTVSSETQDEVGMSSILLDNVGELYLNSFCFGFRLNDFSTLLPEFARYFFRSYPFRREVFKLSQGATRFNLSKNELIKLKIIIPSLEEQVNIANILSTADSEIQTEKEKLTVLKSQKKGLMQQLLTGKKRVD